MIGHQQENKALEIEKSSSWLGRPLPMTVFPLFTYTMMTVFVRLLVCFLVHIPWKTER
jgi:hypothetical protein